MKRIIVLAVLFVLLLSGSAQALDNTGQAPNPSDPMGLIAAGAARVAAMLLLVPDPETGLGGNPLLRNFGQGQWVVVDRDWMRGWLIRRW